MSPISERRMSEKDGTKALPPTTPPTAAVPAARRPVEPSVPSTSAATGNRRAAEGLSTEASAGLRLIATADAGAAARWVRSTGLEACSASVLAASSSRQDATLEHPFSMVCLIL